MQKLNIINQRFHNLLVLEEVEPHIQPSGAKMRKYKCLCDCGTIKEIVQPSLTRGLSKSCGCLKIEKLTTHNKTNTKEYQVWRDIKQRCSNPKSKNYIYYGGRGIKMCKAWIDSFETFLNDVGEAPNKQSTLDRIDNNKNYQPGNIRWTNFTVQNINKRLQKRNASGCIGVRWHKQANKWCAYINVDKKYKHLGLFSSLDEAIKARKQAEEIYYKPLLS